MTGGGSSENLSTQPPYKWEQVTNLCTDAHGNVYMISPVGSTNIKADTFYEALAHNPEIGAEHFMLASYSCNGALRWAKVIECYGDEVLPSGLPFNGSNGGLVYSEGSVYVTGTFGGEQKWIGYDTTFFDSTAAFMARFDTSGKCKWVRPVGSPDINAFALCPYPGSIAVDGDGYIHHFDFMNSGVHLTSTVTSTTGTYDLKYDTSGALLSAKRVQMDTLMYLWKVMFNKQSGKFYSLMATNQKYPFTLFNTAMAAFRPDESMIWMDTTGNTGAIYSFDYNGDNALYACGRGGYPDTFSFGGITVTDTIYPHYYAFATIFKLDTNGVAKWVYNLQSNQGVDRFLDIAILPGENIAAGGAMADTSIHGADTLVSTAGEQSNPLIAIIDSSGRTIKLDQLHSLTNNDQIATIASDAAGNVYMGGMMEVSISATGLTPYVTNGGNTDFFVVKYGYDCMCLVAPAANFTYSGTTSVSFTYTGTVTFDSLRWNFDDSSTSTVTNPTHTYATTGTQHVCVTIYTPCGDNTFCKDITTGTTSVSNAAVGNINIYPNPATAELTIEHADKGTSIKLFDPMGRQVYSGTTTLDKETVNMNQLAQGAYLLQLTATNGTRTTHTIVKE